MDALNYWRAVKESGLKIWVQSTIVNAGSGGVILKDYAVK